MASRSLWIWAVLRIVPGGAGGTDHTHRHEQKVLLEPMLYLSIYFKTHRQYYCELLNNVRLTGGWEDWLKKDVVRAFRVNTSRGMRTRIEPTSILCSGKIWRKRFPSL